MKYNWKVIKFSNINRHVISFTVNLNSLIYIKELLFGLEEQVGRDHRYEGKFPLASTVQISRRRNVYSALYSIEKSKKIFPKSLETAKFSFFSSFHDFCNCGPLLHGEFLFIIWIKSCRTSWNVYTNVFVQQIKIIFILPKWNRAYILSEIWIIHFH